MGLKEGIDILKDQIDNQLEFIEWLKTKGLYIEMDNSHTMSRMYQVWKAVNKEKLANPLKHFIDHFRINSIDKKE